MSDEEEQIVVEKEGVGKEVKDKFLDVYKTFTVKSRYVLGLAKTKLNISSETLVREFSIKNLRSYYKIYLHMKGELSTIVKMITTMDSFIRDPSVEQLSQFGLYNNAKNKDCTQ